MEPDKAAPRGRIFESSFFLCLVLALVTLAVYWRVIDCDFVNYDDPLYFTSNPHVLSGLTPVNVVWAFTTTHASNWHPMTWLSLMLDAQWFGSGPMGPHLHTCLKIAHRSRLSG